MAATVWNGRITFGLVSIPVKLFTSIQSHDIHFHLLHAKDLGRVHYQYLCEKDNKPVDRSEMVKGYEYEKNEYVVVEDQDLNKIKPESSSNLNIEQFVELSEIDPIYYERTYYLGPSEEGTEKSFALLATAMKKKNRAAIGKLLMRDHEYLALIRPARGGLVLETMYYEDEIKKNENKVKRDVEPGAKEMQLAEMLVENLTEPFDAGKFKSDYIERLEDMLEAKVHGRKVKVFKPRPTKAIPDLLAALEKSVAQTGGGDAVAKRPQARAAASHHHKAERKKRKSA